jgi:hypothetical protein
MQALFYFKAFCSRLIVLQYIHWISFYILNTCLSSCETSL